MVNSPSDLPDRPGGVEAAFVEIFGLVPSPQAVVTAGPSAQAVERAGAYAEYVRELVISLQAESQRLALTANSQADLEHAASKLLRLEAGRYKALAPFMAVGNVPEAGMTAPLKRRSYLRNMMAAELGAIRDARLRIEFRRAELINQQVGASVRIVIRGAAQVRLHFGKSTDHADKKA